MGWDWLLRLLGAPIRHAEARVPEPPRRVRPLEAPPAVGAPLAVDAGDAQAERLAELRAKHGFRGVEPRPARERMRLVDPETTGRGAKPERIVRDGAPPSFVIEYEDYEGRATRRSITVEKLTVQVDDWGNEVAMIQAYCHLRRDTRHFRVDRIQAVIDADGTVIDDPVPWLSRALRFDL